ncbi:hypothetical protein FRC01_009703, partial [Tulasnella sp. 417]
MSAELPKLMDEKQCGTASLAARRYAIFPISELPSELFGLVLHFYLPVIDPMEWVWKHDECRPYITELYNLRHVSPFWRDTIDGTPSFWMLVSSDWPQEFIHTALSRSGAGPLIVHHIPSVLTRHSEIISNSKDFLRLIDPFRPRWVAAVFRLPAQLLPEFTDTPIPRLDTLKLSLTGRSSAPENNKIIPCTPTLVNTLANLEHLHLDLLPFKWDQVASAFTRLRTLMLSSLRHCITFDLLFQAINNNPFLERIVLINIKPDGQSPPLWSPDPVLPPRLRVFQVSGGLDSLDHILSRMQFPPTLEVLVIVARASRLHGDVPSWIKMISPLSSTIQRLHETYGGSTIFLKDEAACNWKTNAGPRGFKLQIRNMDPALSLKCFAPVANTLQCTNGLPHLGFTTESAYIEDDDLLETLVTFQTITHIQISIEVQNLQIARFLEVLSMTDADTNGDMVSFPCLQDLKLRRWQSDIDGLVQALGQRYSAGVGEGASQPHQELRIYFTESAGVWFEDGQRPKVIISMEKIKGLRDIEGIQRVWYGCSAKQPGMLAVVWSEEEGREVWG